MLDENLPTYLLRPSTAAPKQHETYFYTQHGSDPSPSYSLRHPDPASHDARNRYAAALYDAYNPDVLFAEVLLIPSWTTPNPTNEDIRKNGGVPPPPEPILPTEFTIQLYNPDQQVVVRQKKPGHFTSTPSWQFELPQRTFREPSSSTLDRTQDDPTVLENTPKIRLKWKKDSKLSRDLACFLSGKTRSAEEAKHKRSKEPDITVAIFRSLKEMTLYEPNLPRVDIEDMKGFEVVLLLGAAVIRDVYFGNMKEVFNIGERRLSQPASPSGLVPGAVSFRPTTPGEARIPPTDPRTQWEIDTQTALLKKQTMQEEREKRRQEEEEQRRLKRMLAHEEKEKARKQAEIDMETERLRRLYGQEDSQARPALPLRNTDPYTRHSSYQPQEYSPAQQYPSHYPQDYHNGYTGYQPSFTTGGGPMGQNAFLNPQPQPQPLQRVRPKHSFFGFRRGSDEDDRLQRKKSAVF